MSSPMSIAVSTTLRPSRVLRLALLLFGALHAGVAIALACRPGTIALAWLVSPACALACALAVRAAARHTSVHQIDISGRGEIGLTVQQSMRRATPDGAPVQRLMPGSTLWPQFLLLLLRDQAGVA